MAKFHFQFNPETLSYIKVRDRKFKIKTLFSQFSIIIILTIILTVAFSKYITSPVEKQLNEANQELLLDYAYLNEKIQKLNTVLTDIEKRDDKTYRPFFSLEPLPVNVRNAGTGGTNKYESFKSYENSDIVINTSKLFDRLKKKMVIQSVSHDEVIEYVKNKEKLRKALPAICPISKTELTHFGSAFGKRFHPIFHKWKMHTGIDLSAPRGSKVYVTGNGKVVKAAWGNGYGKMVVVDHGFSYKTVYAHLSKIDVKEGDVVTRGQIIGRVGSTGTSTCNHLHYEVRINDVPKNPLNYYSQTLTDEEFSQVLANEKNAPLSDI